MYMLFNMGDGDPNKEVDNARAVALMALAQTLVLAFGEGCVCTLLPLFVSVCLCVCVGSEGRLPLIVFDCDAVCLQSCLLPTSSFKMFAGRSPFLAFS